MWMNIEPVQLDWWIWFMDRTVILNSGQKWPTVWTSALIHGNEPYWKDVLSDVYDRVRNWHLVLNRWRLITILEWNTLARNTVDPKTWSIWVRFVEHDLNRIVASVPEDEQVDNYEQVRWKEIKQLIDETEPSKWLDLHSFSAPNGLPYAFSGLEWYHHGWKNLWIQNMAVNMANANMKADNWERLWQWVADYINSHWWHWYTFEAWHHEDPQCYVNTYQALINYLVSLDMLDPKEVTYGSNGMTLLMPHNDIVKIGWNESSHVHIEEKHLFTGWFRYAWEHPQSFRKYQAWEIIWYDVIDSWVREVRAPYDGYIIMPKDPTICIKWKEVFYYWKDMSEVRV